MARILLQRLSWRLVLLIAAESALIVGAVVLAAWIRLGHGAWGELANEHGLWKAALVAAVCQLCLYYADLYDLRIVGDRRELFVRALQSLGAASLVLAILYYLFPDLVLGRGVFFVAAVLVVGIIVGWRLAFEWLSKYARPSERLLLVGTGVAAVGLAAELHERRQELGVEIVGFVDTEAANVGKVLLNPGIIGIIDDIPSIVEKAQVDRVVVSLADARGKLPMERLLDMKLNDGVRFDHLASVYEEYTGKIALENLRPSWLIFSEGFRKTRWLVAAKRASDVVAAAVGLVVALPVMLLVAAAIKLSSPGPVLYHQNRVGQHGRLFLVHKFRSMRPDAEAETGAVWAAAGGDPRVTGIGRVLRRTRLDELPQLWNVLIGNMSFVGPRPERPEFVSDLTRQIPFYGQRHVVKPGLTGWAQVRYTYGASVEDSMEKLQYDLFYIKNLSMALDVYIVLETIKTVLMRRGS
jgi:sugar transferase (PEP-CTERM system associated)